MIDRAVAAGASASREAGESPLPRRTLDQLVRRPWLTAAVAITAIAVAFVVATGMRPAYDAYGWLVWGREALHLDLDTNAAPSWKPLTFLFTLPYALTGRGALWLWMETAVAAALAGSVFAGRIAYRLTGPSVGRPWAPFVAAVFAGLGVLGIAGYGHFVLIADSDPMIVTLCLGAIDCHLSGRRRLTWVLLVLAALGRPEAWLVVAAYGLWAWRALPGWNRRVAIGGGVILVLWFAIPALTSHSWLIAGDVAQTSSAPVSGNKFVGVLDRFLGLYELPMQLAVAAAMLMALFRRLRDWLVLVAAASVWVAVEIAFALHGWPASPRYMFEPAAVLVVVAGAGVGRILAISSRATLARWVGVAAVAALVVALVPHVRIRARLLHNGIVLGRNWARQIHRLQKVIAEDGGSRRILACGQAVTEVPFQSIVAWELGENVVDVGWQPGKLIRRGRPMVLFEPHGTGWQVRPIHVEAAKRSACAQLRTDTAID